MTQESGGAGGGSASDRSGSPGLEVSARHPAVPSSRQTALTKKFESERALVYIGKNTKIGAVPLPHEI
jgi:hypothetical protein